MPILFPRLAFCFFFFAASHASVSFRAEPAYQEFSRWQRFVEETSDLPNRVRKFGEAMEAANPRTQRTRSSPSRRKENGKEKMENEKRRRSVGGGGGMAGGDDAAQALEQVLAVLVLGDEGFDADVASGFFQGGRSKRSEHEQVRFGHELLQAAGSLDAVHDGHGKVEDDDFGPQFCRGGNTLGTVGGFAAHFPFEVVFDGPAHTAADVNVIVDDQDRMWHGREDLFSRAGRRLLIAIFTLKRGANHRVGAVGKGASSPKNAAFLCQPAGQESRKAIRNILDALASSVLGELVSLDGETDRCRRREKGRQEGKRKG